jgi:4-nitrophenyl phosphatase
VLNILQAHYVERMGRAFVVNVPWWINAFFTALSPFLDPATREKIKFNASLSSFIAPEQLDAEFGGAHNYQWDFDAYWSSLLDAANLLPDGTRRVGARRAVAEACTAPPLPGREAESTPTPAPPYASSVDAVAEPTSSSSPAAAAAATATDGETLSRFLSHTHRTENASAEGSAVGSTVESHLTETRGETAPSTAPTSVHGHEQIKPVS